MVTSLRSKWAVGSVGMRSRVSGAACPHDSKHRLEAYATLGRRQQSSIGILPVGGVRRGEQGRQYRLGWKPELPWAKEPTTKNFG
jgi:hypothetical protein